MGKYYVVSGSIKMAISAPHIETEEDAACEAVLVSVENGSIPANYVVVSERGFDVNSHEEDDKIFSTIEILKKTGLLEDKNEY